MVDLGYTTPSSTPQGGTVTGSGELATTDLTVRIINKGDASELRENVDFRVTIMTRSGNTIYVIVSFAINPNVPVGDYYLRANGANQVYLWSFSITAKPYRHRLSYNSNGGGGTMQDSIVTDTNSGYSAVTSANCTFTPPANHVFIGWDTDPSGSGVQPAGTQFYVLGDSRLELYAIWARTYTLTLSVSPSNTGSTTGSGTYIVGTSVNISAIDGNHYHFDHWSDGNTSRSRTVSMTSDITLVAHFAIDRHTVSLSASPADKGTVTISPSGGVYDYGTVVTISATPVSHYHFDRWSDGNTSASRSITVTNNISLTAYFAIDTFEIRWANWDGIILRTDTVTYGSTPSYGSTPTRPATAQYVYTFTGWTPTIESATGPKTYTAQYTSTINRHAVTLSTSGNGSGSVSISPSGGTYDYGTEVTISATANEHSHFNQWSDGVTDNPRTFTVTGPVTLSAEIALDLCIISVQTNGDGGVTGAGAYNYGDTVTLTATARKLSKFIKWTLDGWTLNGSEEVYNNPLTFQAVEDVSVTAYFETVNGVLILSYTEGGQIYTLECGTVTAVSDTVRANILQTPIPVYSADNAFTFDTGATENIQVNIVRRNPENIVDPGNIPDNVPDIYDVDWSKYDTARWSNRVWKMALISMIDRWQMKSDGLSVDFTPVVTNELGGGIYQAAIRENGYIKSLDISYDVTSFEVLRVTLHIAIGSINKNKVM